jgi:hypothetical protein
VTGGERNQNPAKPVKPAARVRPVIGWREWVAIPELGIAQVKAKVDTGARTSALHAFDIRGFKRRGRRMVRFRVHPIQRSVEESVEAEAVLLDERVVRSSMGKEQFRRAIRVDVTVAGLTFPIELTLTSRDSMGYRMLLGREALQGRFLVDPSRSYLGLRRPSRGSPSDS